MPNQPEDKPTLELSLEPVEIKPTDAQPNRIDAAEAEGIQTRKEPTEEDLTYTTIHEPSWLQWLLPGLIVTIILFSFIGHYLVSISFLVSLGALSLSSLILSKKPEAAVILAKVSDIQSLLGGMAMFWGAWSFLGLMTKMDNLSFVAIIIWLAGDIVLLCLGALFGIGALKKLTDSVGVHTTINVIKEKLSKVEVTLGIAGIAVAGVQLLHAPTQ